MRHGMCTALDKYITSIAYLSSEWTWLYGNAVHYQSPLVSKYVSPNGSVVGICQLNCFWMSIVVHHNVWEIGLRDWPTKNVLRLPFRNRFAEMKKQIMDDFCSFGSGDVPFCSRLSHEGVICGEEITLLVSVSIKFTLRTNVTAAGGLCNECTNATDTQMLNAVCVGKAIKNDHFRVYGFIEIIHDWRFCETLNATIPSFVLKSSKVRAHRMRSTHTVQFSLCRIRIDWECVPDYRISKMVVGEIAFFFSFYLGLGTLKNGKCNSDKGQHRVHCIMGYLEFRLCQFASFCLFGRAVYDFREGTNNVYRFDLIILTGSTRVRWIVCRG